MESIHIRRIWVLDFVRSLLILVLYLNTLVISYLSFFTLLVPIVYLWFSWPTLLATLMILKVRWYHIVNNVTLFSVVLGKVAYHHAGREGLVMMLSYIANIFDAALCIALIAGIGMATLLSKGERSDAEDVD